MISPKICSQNFKVLTEHLPKCLISFKFPCVLQNTFYCTIPPSIAPSTGRMKALHLAKCKSGSYMFHSRSQCCHLQAWCTKCISIILYSKHRILLFTSCLILPPWIYTCLLELDWKALYLNGRHGSPPHLFKCLSSSPMKRIWLSEINLPESADTFITIILPFLWMLSFFY